MCRCSPEQLCDTFYITAISLWMGTIYSPPLRKNERRNGRSITSKESCWTLRLAKIVVMANVEQIYHLVRCWFKILLSTTPELCALAGTKISREVSRRAFSSFTEGITFFLNVYSTKTNHCGFLWFYWESFENNVAVFYSWWLKWMSCVPKTSLILLPKHTYLWWPSVFCFISFCLLLAFIALLKE